MSEDIKTLMQAFAREHDELLKNKARLDWLADRDNPIGNVQLPTECVARNLHSLRDAIDAAMAMDTREIPA